MKVPVFIDGKSVADGFLKEGRHGLDLIYATCVGVKEDHPEWNHDDYAIKQVVVSDGRKQYFAYLGERPTQIRIEHAIYLLHPKQ